MNRRSFFLTPIALAAIARGAPISKVDAMARAIVAGWDSVQSTYQFGASWGGPVNGAAMAAIAAAATALDQNLFKNASFDK